MLMDDELDDVWGRTPQAACTVPLAPWLGGGASVAGTAPDALARRQAGKAVVARVGPRLLQEDAYDRSISPPREALVSDLDGRPWRGPVEVLEGRPMATRRSLGWHPTGGTVKPEDVDDRTF